MAPSGFAIGFHIRLTAPEFQFQTYPKSWTEIYSQNGYVLQDPSVRWSMTNLGACRWSDLLDGDSMKIFDQAAEFAMKYGASVSVQTDDSLSIAGFSRPDREYTDAELGTLVEHVQTLHDLTNFKNGMSQDLRNQLHRLSVEMTHPV